MSLDGRRVLVTGGTGSLGRALVRRLLALPDGERPASITVFSRDEAKQHALRLQLVNASPVTDEVLYRRSQALLRFRIGSVTDRDALAPALRGADVVFNAAALKQVPTCEHFPAEAVRTNVEGANNLVRTIADHGLDVEVVVGISSDKACKPVNVMGMTKALQERVLAAANVEVPTTRFVLARYGNVLASRGSVVPLFHHQIRTGGPVTITTEDMTRFLMSLDEAVDTVLAAARGAHPGETYIPLVPSARVVDLAAALIGDRGTPTQVVGIRPGEKVHEVLVSEEESARTVHRDGHLVIGPLLPELRRAGGADEPPYSPDGHREFSSSTGLLDRDGVAGLLARHRLRVGDSPDFDRGDG